MLEKYGFFAEVLWHKDDLLDAMESVGIKPTEKNIGKFLASRAPRFFEARLTEIGWDILDDIVQNMKREGVFEEE